MSFLLVNVLAAASLVSAGIGATGETRSAQSLPTAHLAGAHASTADAPALRSVNRLADASVGTPGSGQSDEDSCNQHGGHWDANKKHCLRGAEWWGNGGRLEILGGTTAGIIYALTTGDSSISN